MKSIFSTLREREQLYLSRNGLPGFIVPGDGVEDQDELVHAGDHGNLVGFAGGSKSLIKSLDDGVVRAGAERRHIKRLAYAGTAAPDTAPSF